MHEVGLWPVVWQSTVMYESYTTGGEHSICLGGVVVVVVVQYSYVWQ